MSMADLQCAEHVVRFLISAATYHRPHNTFACFLSCFRASRRVGGVPLTGETMEAAVAKEKRGKEGNGGQTCLEERARARDKAPTRGGDRMPRTLSG